MRHPHVWVMTDDMYEHLVYDGFEFATPAAGGAGPLRPHADLQWRLQGLCHDRLAHRLRGGPEELIGAMRKVQSQSTSNPCSISQWAAVEALNGPQDFIATNNETFKRRRDLVVEMLNARSTASTARCRRARSTSIPRSRG
jgi:aspartate aminotransferase